MLFVINKLSNRIIYLYYESNLKIAWFLYKLKAIRIMTSPAAFTPNER